MEWDSKACTNEDCESMTGRKFPPSAMDSSALLSGLVRPSQLLLCPPAALNPTLLATQTS